VALERVEAAQRAPVIRRDQFETVGARVVAADGEGGALEFLLPAMPRFGLRRRRALLRLLAAGEREGGSDEDARANSRRR
jgi:hypothetical protein